MKYIPILAFLLFAACKKETCTQKQPIVSGNHELHKTDTGLVFKNLGDRPAFIAKVKVYQNGEHAYTGPATTDTIEPGEVDVLKYREFYRNDTSDFFNPTEGFDSIVVRTYWYYQVCIGPDLKSANLEFKWTQLYLEEVIYP